jgi:hypothetical protein
MNIGLLVIGFAAFFTFLGMVAYGARLEQKYKELMEEKEKAK